MRNLGLPFACVVLREIPQEYSARAQGWSMIVAKKEAAERDARKPIKAP